LLAALKAARDELFLQFVISALWLRHIALIHDQLYKSLVESDEAQITALRTHVQNGETGPFLWLTEDDADQPIDGGLTLDVSNLAFLYPGVHAQQPNKRRDDHLVNRQTGQSKPSRFWVSLEELLILNLSDIRYEVLS